MTAVNLTSPHRERPGPTDLPARPSLTLAEEHGLMLWQVMTSAEKLVAAAEHGRWPGAELTALAVPATVTLSDTGTRRLKP